jgi:trimeric autotransporter adhesin
MKTSIRFFEIIFAFLCLALLPNAQAVNPPPDGGYPGFNTAEGQNALFGLTTGIGNTAVGWFSLFSNTDGSFNTGVGAGTLLFNVGNQGTGVGTQNTAFGAAALLFNTIGAHNTATGTVALLNNTTGDFNTATGSNALYFNTQGDFNTATGFGALYKNTTGELNTANGHLVLYSNTTGFSNTANGIQALYNNTSGFLNTAIGATAGFGITTGDANTCLGIDACSNTTTADNVVCVGSGAAGENFSNRAYIPNIGVFAQAPAAGIEFVTVRLSDGKLGHDASARRYKEDIKPMGDASEVLYQLKPVTFKFKEEDVDPKKGPQPQNLDYGLIAEDVAEIDPKLAIRDGKGQIESVRYKAIYNMMLNEFLKEHRKVQQQEAAITELTSTVAQQRKDFETAIVQQRQATEALLARLNEQEARLQKVSAQIAVHKPEAQMVVENQ